MFDRTCDLNITFCGLPFFLITKEARERDREGERNEKK